MEDDSEGSSADSSVLEMQLDHKEVDQTLTIRQEEFAELDRGDDLAAEELKDKKVGGNTLDYAFVV